jgi:chitodextrinase
MRARWLVPGIALLGVLGLARPAMAQEEAPPPPANVTATAVSSSQIDVSWSRVSAGIVTAYRVYYTDGTFLDQVGSGTLVYSDTGLQPLTQYDYFVTTVTLFGGESDPSSSASAVTLDGTPPSTPTLGTPVGVSTTEIDLSWTAATDPETGISDYVVYRDGVEVARTGTNLDYRDGGLQADTEYEYRVSAVNGDGIEGALSNAQTGRTLLPDPPSAPTNLQATAASASAIDLSWTAPGGGSAVGYRVYRDGSPVADPTGTSYRDSGLSAFTEYTYTVTARDAVGQESAPSQPAAASTLDGSPPSRPQDLTAEAASASSIQLNWSAATDPETGISAYRVYRDGEQVGETGGTSYLDTGLDDNTEYRYRVSAVNGQGLEGDRSQEARATTLDGSGPTRPEDLQATAVSANRIDLTWSAASDPQSGISGYIVYRDGVEVASPAGTSFSDSGLQPSTEYTYRVSAVNGQGIEGSKSDRARATTFDDTPPTKPGGLSATAAGTDRIDLDWSAASDPESGISGYIVYRDGERVATPSGTSYTDGGLQPATEYDYRVSAVNGQGLEGPRSDPASATTLDATPPSRPQGLVASPVGTERIDLTWAASSDPESGIAEYIVLRDGEEIDRTTQTSFPDGGLSPATEYTYAVVAVNGDGLESDPSDTATATTLDGSGPSAPTDLQATAIGTDRIDLTWSPAEDPETGIASYKVFRDGAEVGTTTDTSFEDSGLQPATEYEYRVSAINGEGLEGSLSDAASATTLDGSGPTAPSDLAATPVSQSQIDLTWSASEDPESGVTSYNVYRDDELVASVPGTSFSDTALDQNTSYTYSVAGVNGEGLEGSRSTSVTARTFPAEGQIPPAPPTGLRVVTP